MRYFNCDIVFAEIPDETSLAINISGCPNRCPGCHSPHLQKDEGTVLDERELDFLLRRYGRAITCVCFMGGDACPEEVASLAAAVHRKAPHLHTAWYSGRDLIPETISSGTFDYIKTGPYIESLGPLGSPDTNQRLYRVEGDSMRDITPLFWRKGPFSRRPLAGKVIAFLIAICLQLTFSCGQRHVKMTQEVTSERDDVQLTDTVKVEYAEGFRLIHKDGFTMLELSDPQAENREDATSFALVPKGTDPKDIPRDCRVIQVPVSRLVCMTSLQLSNILALGRADAVVGVTSVRHLHDPVMNSRIAEGKARRIGIEGNFDSEVIMGLDPDLIIISPYKRGGYDALRNVGIPLLPHYGYKETTPLGQAEWIKCIGALLGCQEEADSLFEGIKRRYNALASMVRTSVSERPEVFSGELRGGNWYAVGGKSYLARLFEDAGADYFLKDDNRSGGVVMDFEQVYSQAAEARFWRILNSFDGEFSYGALGAEDVRYKDFRAWKERGVIYCNLRLVPFYEVTPVEPDVVLADFIKAFHPDLLPDYEPVYYRLLVR